MHLQHQPRRALRVIQHHSAAAGEARLLVAAVEALSNVLGLAPGHIALGHHIPVGPGQHLCLDLQRSLQGVVLCVCAFRGGKKLGWKLSLIYAGAQLELVTSHKYAAPLPPPHQPHEPLLLALVHDAQRRESLKDLGVQCV